jgi:hypothetical protein
MLDEKHESNLNMDQFCDLLSPIQSQSWKSAGRRRRAPGRRNGSRVASSLKKRSEVKVENIYLLDFTPFITPQLIYL